MKKELTVEEIDKFRSAMLYEFAVMDAKSDWVQQFHYGATRNNNVRMFKQLVPTQATMQLEMQKSQLR